MRCKILTLLMFVSISSLLQAQQTPIKNSENTRDNSAKPLESKKKNVDTCGGLVYNEQPIESCQDLTHFELNNLGDSIHKEGLKFSDRFGNIYCDAAETIKGDSDRNSNSETNTFNSSAGNFVLNYGNSVPADFITIIDQVFSDIEQLLVFNNIDCNGNINPVRIKIDIENLTTQTQNPLAVGSSYYTSLNYANNLVYGKVWQKINTGNSSNSFINNNSVQNDGFIKINSSDINSFYTEFGTDINNDNLVDGLTADLYDLYGVILHEAIHCLGFSSLITSNGNPLTKVSIFDTLLNNNGNPYTSNTNDPYNWVRNWNNFDEFQNWYQGSCTQNTIEATNGSSIPLFTSDYNGEWISGASFSHIVDECSSTNYVMNSTTDVRDYNRLTQDEIDILQSLQYSTTTQYGTELLTSTSLSNPNIKVFNSNANSAQQYALTDACSTFFETIEACQGNTFTFTQAVLNQLKANDINAENSTVINLELEFPNNNDISLQQNENGDFELEVINNETSGAYFIVQYQLVNALGKVSNTSNILFYIIPCDSLGSPYLSDFACEETSEGNDLICNSELIAGQIGEINSHNSAITNGMFGVVPNNTIDGWFGFNRIRMGAPPIQEALTRPMITDDNYIVMLKNSFLTAKLKEDIQPNKDYLLSYFQSGPNGIPDPRANVGLFKSIQNDTPYPNAFYQSVTQFNPSPLIQNEAVPVLDNNWEQRILSFTADDAYEAFYLSSDNVTVLFDQVELIEDKLNANNINTEVSNCEGTDTTLGINLVDITGVNYSWFNITNGFPGTQLTNGNNDEIPDDNYTPIGNGSQLQINNATNGIFELRRTFLPITTFDGVTTQLSQNNSGVTSIQITLNCDENPCNPDNACSDAGIWPLVGEVNQSWDIASTDIEADCEGNLYSIGKWTNNDEFVQLKKHNKEGEELWSKSVTGGFDLKVDNNSHIYLMNEASITKYNTSNGSINWTVNENFTRGNSIAVDKNTEKVYVSQTDFATKNSKISVISNNGIMSLMDTFSNTRILNLHFIDGKLNVFLDYQNSITLSNGTVINAPIPSTWYKLWMQLDENNNVTSAVNLINASGNYFYFNPSGNYIYGISCTKGFELINTTGNIFKTFNYVFNPTGNDAKRSYFDEVNGGLYLYVDEHTLNQTNVIEILNENLTKKPISTNYSNFIALYNRSAKAITKVGECIYLKSFYGNNPNSITINNEIDLPATGVFNSNLGRNYIFRIK